MIGFGGGQGERSELERRHKGGEEGGGVEKIRCLDPALDTSSHRQDLLLKQDPKAFKERYVPFHFDPQSACSQNQVGAKLTTHWSHSLRGQKY